MRRDFSEVREWLAWVIGVPAPWSVAQISEPEGNADVEITLKHGGGDLQCPKCERAVKRHDGVWRTWRDLDIHLRKTTIKALVPRVKCPEHGVLTLPVPWADRSSRFTAHFEAAAMELLKECSVSAAAKRLGITWDQAAGVQERAVRRGLERRNAAFPRRIGVDETSFRKRHRYVTVVNDLDTGAVLHVAETRSKAALDGFFQGLGDEARKGIGIVAMDMHAPYILSAMEHTRAQLAFDRFHVVQRLARAVDQVRRGEQRSLGEDAAELKGTRHLWLYGAAKLKGERRDALDGLARRYKRLGRAWSIKQWASDLWTPASHEVVECAWREWLSRVQRCRLRPMVQAGRMVRKHLLGIVNAVCEGVTNARAESVNARIQWMKRLANGYRSMERFIMAIMFHLGKLDMRPHAQIHCTS